MISRDEAVAIFRREMPESEAWRSPEELRSAWFFASRYIGSCGSVVDKTDGHFHVFGSSFPLELWTWAYERGFRWDTYDVVVTRVNDLERTVELLQELARYPGSDHFPPRGPSQGWLEQGLAALPLRLSNQKLWMHFEHLRDLSGNCPCELSVEPDTRASVSTSARRARHTPESLIAVVHQPDIIARAVAAIDAGEIELEATSAVLAATNDSRLWPGGRRRRSIYKAPFRIVERSTAPATVSSAAEVLRLIEDGA